MSHWQRIEELFFTLPSGRRVVFARCACNQCKTKGQLWQLDAEDALPLSDAEREQSWLMLDKWRAHRLMQS
ncbi:MAG: hypothetical protein CMM54_00105 [Rhodospirillaceae bacterium]|nr:hypothetical protein [Rhodospirillaceae bacterium]|tara:strand:- start:508 stop:720 length:213 start_codon:yes stop_codon:yes gene_type:complete